MCHDDFVLINNLAKENNTQIRYVIPLDKDDELELKVICEELNQSKF